MGRPKEKNYACHAGKDGSLTIKRLGKTKRLDTINFCWSNFKPGETCEVILETADGGRVYRQEITPNPLHVSDHHGRQLRLVMFSPDGMAYIAELSHFDPYEEITILSITRGEESERHIRANRNGKACVLLHPGVKGLRGGNAHVTIHSESSHEPLRMAYTWGNA